MVQAKRLSSTVRGAMRDECGFKCQTVNSYSRQRPTTQYGSVLRAVSERFSKIQDEIATESIAGIEFEESARRSFQNLNGQVRTIKEAFNALVDHLSAEIQEVKTSISGEISVALGLQSDQQQLFGKELTDSVQALRVELFAEKEARLLIEDRNRKMAQDVEHMLVRFPNVEDNLRAMEANCQDTLNRFDQLADAVNRVEDYARRLEPKLREDVEERQAKLQKTFQRQFDGLHQMVRESDDRQRDLQRATAAAASQQSFRQDRASSVLSPRSSLSPSPTRRHDETSPIAGVRGGASSGRSSLLRDSPGRLSTNLRRSLSPQPCAGPSLSFDTATFAAEDASYTADVLSGRPRPPQLGELATPASSRLTDSLRRPVGRATRGNGTV